MLDLESAIRFHEEEVEKMKLHKKVNEIILGTETYDIKLQEHTQTAEWLKELRERRERSEIAKPTGESEQFVPNEDLISRKSAIDAIEQLVIPEDMCVFEILSHIELAIGTLPPTQPEQKWTPVSERLPEESGYYIITAHDGVGHRTTFAKFQKKAKSWDLTGARSYWKVIAWMPLPEPYAERRTDD